MSLNPINKLIKISTKMTILYALMFSVVLVVIDASILLGIKYNFVNQAYSQIEDTKKMILNKTPNEDITSSDIISDIPFNENISVKITDSDGNVLNSTNSFRYKNNFKEEYDKVLHIEENEKHLYFENIKVETNKNLEVNILIVKDMHHEYELIKVLFAILAAADAVGIIASVIIGATVSKKMLKPIDDITKTAESISINNLKERIETTGNDDELSRLANTLNNMIDRLQESFDSQIQFVSDASHELRTPISVIQGHANLLDRWGKDDRKALEKSIYAIKFETANMANLVENLLFLAKGDSSNLSLDKKVFNLNELISEVTDETRLIAPKYNITNNRNDKAVINADYKMIKQMIRVFLENSIKFSEEGSTIDISAESFSDKVKITVTDHGIGIPNDEIERVFDRFYIVDKSRSKEKSGSGLGLSIAKRIAEMHKGKITAESEPSKYTSITVTLDKKISE